MEKSGTDPRALADPGQARIPEAGREGRSLNPITCASRIRRRSCTIQHQTDRDLGIDPRPTVVLRRPPHAASSGREPGRCADVGPESDPKDRRRTAPTGQAAFASAFPISGKMCHKTRGFSTAWIGKPCSWYGDAEGSTSSAMSWRLHRLTTLPATLRVAANIAFELLCRRQKSTICDRRPRGLSGGGIRDFFDTSANAAECPAVIRSSIVRFL